MLHVSTVLKLKFKENRNYLASSPLALSQTLSTNLSRGLNIGCIVVGIMSFVTVQYVPSVALGRSEAVSTVGECYLINAKSLTMKPVLKIDGSF